ncbi:MAG: hypothetical protein K6G26_07500 [Lachnospiraceae bacterium]|nr:hypothetical protein [Lachnospiraceae bacterium]
MTIEEVFDDFDKKYGDDFNWILLPFQDEFFLNELKNELGKEDNLFNNEVLAVARCESNDDVLYFVGSKDGKVHFVDRNGADIWKWSEEVYEYAKRV